MNDSAKGFITGLVSQNGKVQSKAGWSGLIEIGYLSTPKRSKNDLSLFIGRGIEITVLPIRNLNNDVLCFYFIFLHILE